MKTLLKTWSELYRAFARCAALVATAEENLCCEELSSKIMSSLEDEGLSVSILIPTFFALNSFQVNRDNVCELSLTNAFSL